jgi:histidine ammonia-lyase
MKTSRNRYSDLSLPDIDSKLSTVSSQVTIDGSSLQLQDIISVARNKAKVDFTTDTRVIDQIQTTYEAMMKDVRNGVPIYGCNTGYGAQAGHVVNKGLKNRRVEIARKISEGITHIDVAVGPEFKKEIVRGAMLVRINMLMNGVSAVKLDDLDIFRNMLNREVTPLVNMYGGIGASGDLAHNARVLNVARRMKGTLAYNAQGRVMDAEKLSPFTSPKPALGSKMSCFIPASLITFSASITLPCAL